ncbi:low-density lipoprotein receptor 2-like [Gigantopelta aegis]|uniref:low-density lipoprotein receptor 2-like n=1 Tax=Gigantopelta aegis TaxID=1735272 RepID=UPI001B887747|nr:low-density lipoprotein receptor 2-like [Gigantopelta aegis]
MKLSLSSVVVVSMTLVCCVFSKPPKCKVFKCRVGGCLNPERVCDGFSHCPDGSDEENCSGNKKRDIPDSRSVEDSGSCKQFTCKDGNSCIPQEWVCNGWRECPDNSDEENCKDDHYGGIPGRASCTLFKCRNGACLPLDFVCDGKTDCPGGDDEAFCSGGAPLANQSALDSSSCNTLQCPDGKCIPRRWVCDGLVGCAGGADEMDC